MSNFDKLYHDVCIGDMCDKLNESIIIGDDGSLIVDYSDKSSGGGKFSTRMGKGVGKGKFTPYGATANVHEVPIEVVYSVSATDKDTKNAILKTLKRQHPELTMGKTVYTEFINRTAMFMSSRIVKKFNPDVIISPKSSSYMLNDIVDAIQARSPNVKVLREHFKKVDFVGEIEINRDHPKITDKIIKMLEDALHTAKKNGYFQMKKVKPQYRKFLSNLFELIDEYDYNKLEGQRILILDDIWTTGTTLSDMIDSIYLFAPSEIKGAAVLKCF
jgi:hypothetical protein